MRIVIERPDGAEVEFHVHGNGSASVRVDGKPLGAARWDKRDNVLTFTGLPEGVFPEPKPEETKSGMSFDYEDS